MGIRETRELRVGDLYEELRPYMFAIAYRMVGTVSDAEDIVQEAFLRLHRATTEGEVVESPKAYLSAVTTRLGIDHLRSARVRRESYMGQWLPEPLLTDEGVDVAQHAETADSLSLAFLVLLESLSPVERAVFLLREVFGYDYDEIARVVGKSEDNCRQIAVRARDAGFEVIYQGIRLTPAEIVAAAVEEGVDLVGLSVLSGSHLRAVPDVLNGLRAAGADVPVVVGGIIPSEDERILRSAGVARVFTPKDFALTNIIDELVTVVREANHLVG